MQIIYDLTGSVPMYWRPPEGDVDARVRAIATEVLGLQTVMWNKDADDWCLRQGTGTAQLQTCTTGIGANITSVTREMTSWATTSNRTGFISLEHETTDQAIEAFEDYHRALKRNNGSPAPCPSFRACLTTRTSGTSPRPSSALTASCLRDRLSRWTNRMLVEAAATLPTPVPLPICPAAAPTPSPRRRLPPLGPARPLLVPPPLRAPAAPAPAPAPVDRAARRAGTIGATNKGQSTSGASSLIAGASTVGLGAIAAAFALMF